MIKKQNHSQMQASKSSTQSRIKPNNNNNRMALTKANENLSCRSNALLVLFLFKNDLYKNYTDNFLNHNSFVITILTEKMLKYETFLMLQLRVSK